MAVGRFKEPTADERAARRVLSLAIALTNARTPWLTSRIRADFYPDHKEAAFKKAFLRDRERLEAAGIKVVEQPNAQGESLWSVDAQASYATEDGLSPDDALALDFLLLPIASDPAFPYAQDLRVALTKIDRAFDGTSTASIPPEARKRNTFLSHIEASLLDRHAVRIDYERADGSQVRRDLLPFGLFYLNGETYMAAPQTAPGSPVHTYNLSRVTSFKELATTRYEIPEDFDIQDFIRLPFQLGPTIYTAAFFDPSTKDTSCHEVADESAAAAWAISEGLVPRSPKSLVSVWKHRLKKASGDA